jgi:phosphoribosylaminoimidazole-succinocarboxamide synthase
MSAYNFEQLKPLGVATHFRKLRNSSAMEFDVVRILHPGKDELNTTTTNFLVPLEVIFRNTLPEGSSVFRRLESGQLKIEDLGLDSMPTPGTKLEKPIIDFSTKLEPTDRYLNPEEALEISALTPEEFENMKATALKINDFLTKHAEELGMEHADGKVEFVMNPERKLLLGDVVGTTDEDRFLYKGVHLSKQSIRDYYRLGTWPEEVKKAFAEKRALPDPEKLPQELVGIMSNLYRSVCETWIGEKIWNAPSLDEVVEAYKQFMKMVQC